MRVDVLPVRQRLAQCASEAGDGRVDHAEPALDRTPDGISQLLARADLIRVSREFGKKRELQSRKDNDFAVGDCDVVARPHAKITVVVIRSRVFRTYSSWVHAVDPANTRPAAVTES